MEASMKFGDWVRCEDGTCGTCGTFIRAMSHPDANGAPVRGSYASARAWDDVLFARMYGGRR